MTFILDMAMVWTLGVAAALVVLIVLRWRSGAWPPARIETVAYGLTGLGLAILLVSLAMR